LEKTTSHLIDMMKDEKGNGDDDIWIWWYCQSASEPLIKNNYFHMDVYEQGHHERNGEHE
jgi:hypothetical protein